MIYHQAKDPDSYQRIFYQQIGLKHRDTPTPQNDWSNEAIGSIYTYGTMDTIQFGIGDYTIPQDFLVKNVRHVHLPKELTDLLFQIQRLLETRTMTPELLLALGTTFTAFLIRPDCKHFFFTGADVMSERIFVGKRPIHIRPDDYKKIVGAHDLLSDKADSFVTIYALSHTLGIGEQKLKAGFQQLYQQTIWDYANQVRMTKAASLLRTTDKTVDEIARMTGYQSPAAFRAMFKKWKNCAADG